MIISSYRTSVVSSIRTTDWLQLKLIHFHNSFSESLCVSVPDECCLFSQRAAAFTCQSDWISLFHSLLCLHLQVWQNNNNNNNNWFTVSFESSQIKIFHFYHHLWFFFLKLQNFLFQNTKGENWKKKKHPARTSSRLFLQNKLHQDDQDVWQSGIILG